MRNRFLVQAAIENNMATFNIERFLLFHINQQNQEAVFFNMEEICPKEPDWFVLRVLSPRTELIELLKICGKDNIDRIANQLVH